MRDLLKKIEELLVKTKLRKQMNIIYSIGLFIPMACIGIFLIFNTYYLLNNYHQDLNKSNNLRVKRILFETTKQIYNISEEIVFDDFLQNLLNKEYENKKEFISEADQYEVINNYLSVYQEIEQITIYSNNKDIQDYKQFVKVTDDIKEKDWYKKAQAQISVFWVSQITKDKFGKNYYNLYLVRKIPMTNSVLMIKIDENSLKNILVDNKNNNILLYVNDGGIFFSSVRNWYDIPDMVYINYHVNDYEYEDKILINDKKYMTTISTLQLYSTDNRVYICNLNNIAYTNIAKILSLCAMMILMATILPFFLIRFYTVHFTGRVDTLREAMHKASNENYDVPVHLMGEDEISGAFTDLLKMVEKIKKKDKKMYEDRINAEQLQNAQQKMEMEVLASQINPHFLYNTLETIRMKAFKAGDKDVATAIKLLGKSMRYVLENTGTSSTTLKNELDYIDTYLQIQKLRFSDKINYTFNIEDGLNIEEHNILPLLIQPIVENAIAHGLEEVETGGLIQIDVYTSKNEVLHIDITDNGCGMEADTLRQLRKKIKTPHLNPNKSIGLYNINQRIRLCYGAAYEVWIDSSIGMGTKVSLILPLIANREGN